MKNLFITIVLIAGFAFSAKAQTTTIQTSAFTVSTGLAAEFRDAVCSEFNYQDSVVVDSVLVVNPQTKAQFAQQELDRYTKQWGLNVLLTYRRKTKLTEVVTSAPGLDN